MSNYQPASWEGSDTTLSTKSQNFDTQEFAHNDRRNNNDSANRRWIDQNGRQCQIVCTPPNRPQNPHFIANQIIGLPIDVARRRFPNANIRVVIRNGEHLATTMDFNANRINVETRHLNGRETIIKVVGFY